MKNLTSDPGGQPGKAATLRKTFSRETSVSLDIQADPGIVWALLTNAPDSPRWNSTVVSMKGKIRQGGNIELRSSLDEKRTFKLKVKELEPEKRLVWGDSLGNRIYSLTKSEAGGVRFSMAGKIGGPLFPLFAGSIPPFDESFERFAADLKKEAESIQRSKN